MHTYPHACLCLYGCRSNPKNVRGGSSWLFFLLRKKHILLIHSWWTPALDRVNVRVTLKAFCSSCSMCVQNRGASFKCSLLLRLISFRLKGREFASHYHSASEFAFSPLPALLWLLLSLGFGWDSELFSPQLENMSSIWDWVCCSPFVVVFICLKVTAVYIPYLPVSKCTFRCIMAMLLES